MSLTITKQPHRDIYGIGGDTYVITCSAVSTQTNTLTYTWQTPNDDGEFVDMIPNSDEIISPSNTLSITITEQTKSRVYQCSITDGVDVVTTDYTAINFAQKWYGGPTDQTISPAQGNGLVPVTHDNLIRGGVHIYESVEKMCDANTNYQRVKYGMLAIVKIPGEYQRSFRFDAYDPIFLYNNGTTTWEIGTHWIEMPVMSVDDVDNETIGIIDNKLVAIGGGTVTNNVTSIFIETQYVVETTLPMQTYAYATSSTVGRDSLSAINNSDSISGPYNVLEVSNTARYIPLDLSRANTFIITLSSPTNEIGQYSGFTLINQTPLTSAVEQPLLPNHSYQTFAIPEDLLGKVYTITLFVKHLNVMSTLPLTITKGVVQTDAKGCASSFSVTEIPVKWSSGSPPALYHNRTDPPYVLGSEDVLIYTTHDGGATWYGFIGGVDMRFSG
jgi:hypothetical protein